MRDPNRDMSELMTCGSGGVVNPATQLLRTYNAALTFCTVTSCEIITEIPKHKTGC